MRGLAAFELSDLVRVWVDVLTNWKIDATVYEPRWGSKKSQNGYYVR